MYLSRFVFIFNCVINNLNFFRWCRFSSKKGETLHHSKSLFNSVFKACGQFVVFLYEGNVCPGKIISFNEKNINISAMVKSLKSWKWPEKPDILKYEWNGLLGGINPPKQVPKRGFYSIPELSTSV
jgi:hypothetical protein